jgi:uncharacterized membrane protein
MLRREVGFGVFASALLTILALPLAACGQVKGADEASGNGSGGVGGSSGAPGSGRSGGSSGATGGSRGGSSGATGGSHGGSNNVGGAPTGGAQAPGATGGSSGSAGLTGTGGTGVAGDSAAGSGAAGAGEESASFHWIEATEEHRELAAASTKPARLRTLIYRPYATSVLIGSSELHIDPDTRGFELYAEGIVWTEATGTIGLGGLPGATASTFSPLSDPRAVTADGSVVVGDARNSERRYAPFRWTRAGGMEALAEEGSAVAVSADGSVVVGVRSLPAKAVFRWTRALGAVTIVEPLEGDDDLRVLAVSPDGATVLGESSRRDTTARLFLWEEGAGTRAIENLPGQAFCQVELATFSQSHGFIAAGACHSEAGYEPFLWTGQDELVALGPADALGDYKPSSPVAVTADGSVAVGGAFVSDTESRTYRWTEANGFDFIQLPDGYTDAGAAALSEDGSAIIGRMAGKADHSFLWSASTGAVVLSPLAGHDSSYVRLMSADGSVAAGASSSEFEGWTAAYWRADGIAHSIAEELAAGGIDLGPGLLREPVSTWTTMGPSPVGFFGYGSKDEVSTHLSWQARLP